MGQLELSAHLTVRPGCLEGFKKKDTRTLRYDWFLSDDGTCEVREAYTGPEGLVEHNSHVLEARTKLFKEYADKWFTFFQGLEPAPLVPSQPHGVGHV